MVTSGTFDYATLAGVFSGLVSPRLKRFRELQYLLFPPSPTALDKPGGERLKSARRRTVFHDANKNGLGEPHELNLTLALLGRKLPGMLARNIIELHAAGQDNLSWLFTFLVGENLAIAVFGLKTTVPTEHNKHSNKCHRLHYEHSSKSLEDCTITIPACSPLAVPGVRRFLGGVR